MQYNTSKRWADYLVSNTLTPSNQYAKSLSSSTMYRSLAAHPASQSYRGRREQRQPDEPGHQRHHRREGDGRDQPRSPTGRRCSIIRRMSPSNLVCPDSWLKNRTTNAMIGPCGCTRQFVAIARAVERPAALAWPVQRRVVLGDALQRICGSSAADEPDTH